MFPGLAAEIDASPTTMALLTGNTFAVAGFTSAGGVVSGVLGALRAAGIPWMQLFGLVAKIVPIVIQGIQDGKTFTQIVGEVLTMILTGGI
jgi:hypothetical protein